MEFIIISGAQRLPVVEGEIFLLEGVVSSPSCHRIPSPSTLPVMVLQSFAQYRSFAASRHVGDVAQQHTQTQAAESSAESRHQPPHMSNAQSDAAKAADDGTATSTPIEARSSTHSSSPGRELPGNTVGERVEMEEREKALAVPAVDHSDPFLITWDDGEEANPQNWSWLKKWLLIAMVTSIGLLVGVASSINSAAAEDAAQFFGVGSEVMELQTAVFLIGFGLAAPLLGCEWASEESCIRTHTRLTRHLFAAPPQPFPRLAGGTQCMRSRCFSLSSLK